MKQNYSLLRIVVLSFCIFYLPDAKAEKLVCLSVTPHSTMVAYTPPSDSTTRSYKSIADFAASLKDKKGESLQFRAKVKLLREQLRAIRQAKEETKSNRTLLTILTILAFLGVVVILGVIGYSGGAGLWPFVGLLVSIFLLIFFLKRIRRKKRMDEKTKK